MNRRNALATIAGVVLCWGCSSARMHGSTSSANVIVRDELASLGSMGTLEALQRLRPRFLQPRAASGAMSRSAEYPRVYLDNVRLESVNDLRTVPVSEVFEIRYLDSSDATTRYGTGHTAGAILVTTIRRRG
ncbi:MAG TPA: hypothetical protein VFG84_10705 [Gemmatimonadaceae bacterium]|nr:hypothetical protein [Gemmatimonadaceae bacterium]